MLRSSIKQWEHDFEQREGHKPTASNIKADPEIYALYKLYQAERKQGKGHDTGKSANITTEQRDYHNAVIEKPAQLQSPSKPHQSRNIGPQKSSEAQLGLTETSDVMPDPEATPEKPVREIFPTPQLQGRALGLFDVQLSPAPATPNRNKLEAPVQTPVRTPLRPPSQETPQSKRTPAYLLQRTLFPTQNGEGAPDESPIVPRRTKSVSQLIEEAEALSDVDSDLEREIMGQDSPVDSMAEGENKVRASMDPDSSGGSISDRPYERKRPKRQTRRVIMRPVADTDVAAGGKASNNYRRLAIHKKGNPRFRSRK